MCGYFLLWGCGTHEQKDPRPGHCSREVTLRTQRRFQAEASVPSAAHRYRTTDCQGSEDPTGKLRPREGTPAQSHVASWLQSGLGTQEADNSSYAKL